MLFQWHSTDSSQDGETNITARINLNAASLLREWAIPNLEPADAATKPPAPIRVCCNSLLSSYGQAPKAFRPGTLRSRHGFSWNLEHSPHFDYYFESGSPAARDIAQIEVVLENEYSHIVSLLGAKDLNFHTYAFIVDSRTRMKQLCGHESNGLAVGNVFLFVYGDAVTALGAHEPTHLLSQFLWGSPRGLWLTEGLAVYAEDQWQGRSLHATCKQLKSERKLMPLSSLVNNRLFTQNPEMVTYPEAGSFIKFLYERYGIEAVRSLWTRGADSIPHVLKMPLGQLEAEWLAIITNSSDDATPYKAGSDQS